MDALHVPVLLHECIDNLNIRPDGIYLDGTLGGAGHSLEICRRLTTGRLIGVDRDEVALEAAKKRLSRHARKVTLDSALLGEYLTTLRQGGIDHMLDDNLRLRDVLSMQDVLTVEEADEDQQALSALTLSALDTALDSLCAMRRREGEAMRGDVETRLDTLERTAHAIDERAPQWLEEYRQRLRARIEEICQMQLDEARLTQEVALAADKAAVDEETVRLRSHIAQMRDLLKQSEPAGRKLDFLVQEMNREVNTTGSKSSDLILTGMVVDAKAELEKIREQIQNIE